jgi:hypothetical protein
MAAKSKGGPGFYIFGAADAGWMGAVDGPFDTEKKAIAKAKHWVQPKYDEGQLEVEFSDEENV